MKFTYVKIHFRHHRQKLMFVKKSKLLVVFREIIAFYFDLQKLYMKFTYVKIHFQHHRQKLMFVKKSKLLVVFRKIIAFYFEGK